MSFAVPTHMHVAYHCRSDASNISSDSGVNCRTSDHLQAVARSLNKSETNSFTFGNKDSQTLSFRQSTCESFDKIIRKRLQADPAVLFLTAKPVTKTPVSNTNPNDLCANLNVDHLLASASQMVPQRSLGLQNCGNTCYLNSTLQCILASGPLLALVKRHHSESSNCPVLQGRSSLKHGFCALCGLADLHRQHFKCQNPYLSFAPSYFIRNVRAVCHSLRPNMQEDAHEFLLGLLSRLEDAALESIHRDRLRNRPANKLPPELVMSNVIRQIFGGLNRYEITCQSCQHVSPRDEHWFNLSLDIHQARSLQQCLLQYIRAETLCGQNAYKCTNCKQLRTASRRCTIRQVPPLLIVQFNRFSRSQKLDFPVEFPTAFDIRPYMTTKSGPRVIYRLYATLNHEGYSCRSGHYVAFTRRHGKWFLHNDSFVSTVQEAQVLRNAPYLLFYQREALPVQHKANGVSAGPTSAAKSAAITGSASLAQVNLFSPSTNGHGLGPAIKTGQTPVPSAQSAASSRSKSPVVKNQLAQSPKLTSSDSSASPSPCPSVASSCSQKKGPVEESVKTEEKKETHASRVNQVLYSCEPLPSKWNSFEAEETPPDAPKDVSPEQISKAKKRAFLADGASQLNESSDRKCMRMTPIGESFDNRRSNKWWKRREKRRQKRERHMERQNLSHHHQQQNGPRLFNRQESHRSNQRHFPHARGRRGGYQWR